MPSMKIAIGGMEMGVFSGFGAFLERIFAGEKVGRGTRMRCFEQDLRLGETRIGELKIDVRSRDDIPALLLGLQHLYVTCREELEALLRRHVTADRDAENGRPGMTLWRVLVMAVLKQGLGCDYDRLGELVNHHRVVRQMLQHGVLDEGRYSVRTLRDNVSLVTPALLRELNVLLVREGHVVAGKPPGAALDGRVDSFVVETDVHYPTDVNLLWDALRVLLREVPAACRSQGVPGWRQGRHWHRRVRRGYQRVSRARLWRKRPREVSSWLSLCEDLTERLEDTLEVLAGLPKEDAISEAQLARWRWFHACSVRLQDQIRRRVLEGETIPHSEKVFSLFEPHTRWIMKGKAGKPVELGVPLTVLEDQYQFLLDWQVQWHSGDVDAAIPLVEACQKQYLELSGCSFDRGFHSPANQQQLAGMLDHVALPAKGRGTEASRAREKEAEFVTRRQRHPGVESAIHALECRGLDRVRIRGRVGFERTVGISILAANLHRLGRLLQQQQATQRQQRTHAPPYPLAA